MGEAFKAPRHRRIIWPNVLTVISAAILIGSEVFGAAFAGGWAIASLLGLGQYGAYVLQTVFFAVGLAVMIAFMRLATRAEPFASYENSSGRGDGGRLMERALQAVVATIFLTIAIAMIWHERSRLRAKQPLLRHNAHLLELYWMAYCSLLVLGMTFAISAAIRTSAAP